MSKITNDGLTRSVTECFSVSCTHMAILGQWPNNITSFCHRGTSCMEQSSSIRHRLHILWHF